MGIYKVSLGMLAEQPFGRGHGFLHLPVAVILSDDRTSTGGEFPDETLMASGRRGRPLQSAEFDRLPGLTLHLETVSGRRGSDSFIVGGYLGRIRVAVYLPVEENHRNAPVVNFLYNRSQRLRFDGRGYDDVKAAVGEIAYVLGLFRRVVICRNDLNLSIFMEKNLSVDLFIHLFSPVVIAALRHTDPEFLFLLARSRRQRQENDCKKREKAQNNRFLEFHKHRGS